jgi:putative membrane-bound dehydrogenase-like protein
VVGLTIALLYASATALLYRATYEPDLDEISVPAPELSQITLADGIPIKVFENTVTVRPTALEVGPQGEVYVASIEGQIWIMHDDDEDGDAERVQEFASDLRQPEGLLWSEAGLFVTEIDRVSRLTDTDGDGRADQKHVIVNGFPGEIYAFHQSNGLTLGPDGRLYLGVGATSDHRPETHPWAARILSLKPDGSDLRVYATGLRNPYTIVPAPGGGFFTVDNGSSGCIDTPTQIDDCTNRIDVPEEINYVTEGRDYGFPNYFGIPPQNSGTEPPVVTFPDHSAPTGLILYQGAALPQKYIGQLFVALWSRGEIHTVRVYRIDERHFAGSSRLFASGLAGPSAMHEAPDGSIYLASFTGNTLYTIGRGHVRSAAPVPQPSDSARVAVEEGRMLFRTICAGCHGTDARGVVHLGKSLVGTPFVTATSDEELRAFIRSGRGVHDPANTTGVEMPPSGGFGALTDRQLGSLIAFIRSLR